MSAAELETKLNAMTSKVGKVRTEIQALKDAIANAGNIPQSVMDAADRLEAALQAADDDNPDA